MEIVRRVHSMKEIARQIRAKNRKIGFVPTMGALHDGHLSLVRRVKEVADETVVSVFVNPTQFGANEDLDRYPRDLSRDADLLIAEGVDYLFAPEADEMYPKGPRTYVEVADLSARLEGASRPGHFRGVATVVTKLFEIVRPTVAAFGQKDAQQAVILQRLVRDLMLDVELLILPIVRDDDGIALSSRNVFLSTRERRAARAIPRAIEASVKAILEGETDPNTILARGRVVLEEEDLLRIDYFELVDGEMLRPVPEATGDLWLLAAVYAGTTRLLDNARIKGAGLSAGSG
jgi:pantoate--beta-alanine ligase